MGVGSFAAPGTEIGMARVYDFSLPVSSYETNLNINKWDLSLYDVQLMLMLDESTSYIDCLTFVEGQSREPSL